MSARLSLAEATQIARAAIDFPDQDREYCLLEDRTTEREFGWVFHYETKQFLESGDLNHKVPGVGPFVVERDRGRVTFLSTSVPGPRAIDIFEEAWRAARLDDHGA